MPQQQPPSPASAAAKPPQRPAATAYWTPDTLLDYVSLPYLLIVAYFVGCGLSLGNYVGYVRYHEDRYGSQFLQSYLAFVVVGSFTFVMFSAVLWLWSAKYSLSPEQRARRLKWGCWAVCLLKDLPLFLIECNAIVCCGMNNGYQGFVFVMQSIYALFSFTFSWLTYTWWGAEVFQTYFGGFYQGGLKTGTEQVMILTTGSTPPPPMNAEQRAYSPSSAAGGFSGSRSLGSNVVAYRRANTFGKDVYSGTEEDHHSRGSRYSPPTSPLGRYSNVHVDGSGGAGGLRGGEADGLRDVPYPSPTPTSGGGDWLPTRRHPLPSPWDRRPSPVRHFDLHGGSYSNPQSPGRFSDGSGAESSAWRSELPRGSPPPGAFVISRAVI